MPLDTGEDHVPDSVAPAAHRTVAGVPLLLRVRSDRAVDAAVGDVATAGPAVAGGGEVETALDVHPPEGRGLGDRPPVGAADRGEGEILRRTPEVLGGVAVEPARVDGDITVDRRVVGGQAEARDRGVEAELGVEPVVGARLEQQRVAACAELGRLLLPEHLVQFGLDAGGRGSEHDDVRTEIAAARQGLRLLGGRGGSRRGQTEQRGRGRGGGQRSEDGPSAWQGPAGVRGIHGDVRHGGRLSLFRK